MDRTAPAYERLSGIYDIDWRHAVDPYLPLLDRLLGREEGRRILDLGCGTGLLALELAKRGHKVVGVDLSPSMIDIARKKTSGRNRTHADSGSSGNPNSNTDRKANADPDVTFSVGDIRDFRVDGRFDIVTCAFDTINYVTELPELRATFRCVRDALGDQGQFVFDFATPTMYEAHDTEALHQTIGQEQVTQWLRYDRTSRLAVTWFRFSDDVVEMHRQRAYELVDVARALRECGMAIEKTYSGWRMQAYVSLAQRVICLATPIRRGRSERDPGE